MTTSRTAKGIGLSVRELSGGRVELTLDPPFGDSLSAEVDSKTLLEALVATCPSFGQEVGSLARRVMLSALDGNRL